MKTALLYFAAALFVIPVRPCAAQDLKPIDGDSAAMLRVVQDKEGSANVRSAPGLEAKVTGTVTSGTAVTLFSTEGDWGKIDASGEKDGKAFMHSSRLKKLDGWKQLTLKKDEAGTSAAASVQSVNVEMKSAPFKAGGHKITKDREGMPLVDGRHPWGTDGNLPARTIALTVTVNGKAVALPAAAVGDVFEPDLDAVQILTPGDPAKHMIVTMYGSDGAGCYLAAWTFVNGKYTGRTVTAYEG